MEFKLWMGCLGNGITCCNSAVCNNGDYKQIAHISESGDIRWYSAKVPEEVKEKIQNVADKEWERFVQRNKTLPIRYVYTILDYLPFDVMKEAFQIKDENLRKDFILKKAKENHY